MSLREIGELSERRKNHSVHRESLMVEVGEFEA